jgi:hypothetical protein
LRTAWTLAAVVVCAPACAPSIATLVARRDYGEALCAAKDADAAEKGRVVDAMERDAAPSLYVSTTSEADLRESIGEERAARVHANVLILAVRSTSNDVSGGVGVAVTLLDHGNPVPGRGVGREELAALTGEPIPGYRHETTVDFKDLGIVPAAVGQALLLGTIPFLQIFGYVRTSDTAPTDDDYARAAPAADAILRGMHAAAPSDIQVLSRPRSDDLALAVTVTYGAGASACDVSHRDVVSLPSGGSPEERIAALFGGRWRRVDDLAPQVAQAK